MTWKTDTRAVCLPSDCLYGGCTDYLVGYDYANSDIARLYVQSPGDCCAMCRLRQDCVTWTASVATNPPLACYVKNAKPQLIQASNGVTGFVTR